MIILDTNILSNFMRVQPSEQLLDWIKIQNIANVWVTSVTVFEIERGIFRLPISKRRSDLELKFKNFLEDFSGYPLKEKILDFDYTAANGAAKLAAARETIGRPVDLADLQIAGIVKANRARLATCNTRHFTGLGIELIDPLQGA